LGSKGKDKDLMNGLYGVGLGFCLGKSTGMNFHVRTKKASPNFKILLDEL
jgi:hypothetical protein